MDGFIELLKILIPAAAVFATTYFVVKKFLDNEQKKREMEARKASGSALVPIRLQAAGENTIRNEKYTIQ